MGEVVVIIQNKPPQLYGAIVLIFPSEHFGSSVLKQLPENAECVEYTDIVEVVYNEVRDVNSWEVDDLLTELFLNCDFDALCNLISCYGAKVLIDISFHTYSKFPALVFERRNMQIIHELHADISIDPY